MNKKFNNKDKIQYFGHIIKGVRYNLLQLFQKVGVEFHGYGNLGEQFIISLTFKIRFHKIKNAIRIANLC